MPVAILKKPVEVDNRLEEIGFTKEELLEVVAAMVAARNACTDNNPASARGWTSWSDGVRRLREIALPKGGWARLDYHGVPCIVDEARGLRLTVANTDDGTCLEERTPQNRSRKGAATDRIAAESQGWLFDPSDTPVVSPIVEETAQAGLTATYFLCVYQEGDEVCAELSCLTVVSGGYFQDFAERIFLTGQPGDDGDVRRVSVDDTGPDIEVPVVRKS